MHKGKALVFYESSEGTSLLPVHALKKVNCIISPTKILEHIGAFTHLLTAGTG